MSQLSELESKFQHYLLHDAADIQQHIVSTNKMSAMKRLAIYSNAYRSRLTEALDTSYPVLKMYVGDDEFEQLTLAYLDAHPSSYRSIRWFGDTLADFLRHYAPYQEFAFLPELAALEWTMGIIFDAANSEIVALEEMAAVPPEKWVDLQLQFHPSVQRLDFCWNVTMIWQTLTEDQTPPEPAVGEAQAWLFWRQDLSCQYSLLAPDEAWALDAMRQQATFGEICEGLCQFVDAENAGMRAASLLKGWISAGLIARICFSG